MGGVPRAGGPAAVVHPLAQRSLPERRGRGNRMGGGGPVQSRKRGWWQAPSFLPTAIPALFLHRQIKSPDRQMVIRRWGVCASCRPPLGIDVRRVLRWAFVSPFPPPAPTSSPAGVRGNSGASSPPPCRLAMPARVESWKKEHDGRGLGAPIPVFSHHPNSG